SLSRRSPVGDGGSAPLSTPPRTRGTRGPAPSRLPREHAGRVAPPPLDSPAITRDAWPRPLSTPPRTRGTRSSAPSRLPREHAGRVAPPPLDSPAITRDAWPRPLSTPPRTRGTRGSAPLSTPPQSRKLRAAHHPEIAPAADAKLLGLLEVGDRRGVGRRVDQVRLHGADRQPHLLIDGFEALVV